MRHAHRVDNNQAEIIAALEAAGCEVHDLSGAGNGCVDLLVKSFSQLYLLEVKDRYGKLTADEQAFFGKFRDTGRVWIVRSAEDALQVVNKL